MELPILYEDADIVAVDKPAGVLTTDIHIGVGYAHRLDKDTSGVLIFAKTEEVLAFLKEAFKNREVKKTYLAFTYGVPSERKGTIDFPIGRSRKDFRLRSAQPKAKGMLRDAVTKYEVVGTDGGFTPSGVEGHALLKVMPETGRTHQIRVHLKAINHPIVGDPLYAGKRLERPNSLGLARLGLHAYQLDLPLPSGGRAVITAPVPEELVPALQEFPEGAAFIASK